MGMVFSKKRIRGETKGKWIGERAASLIKGINAIDDVSTWSSEKTEEGAGPWESPF